MRGLAWPLPAVLAWATGWVVALLLGRAGLAPAAALAAGALAAALPALSARIAATPWRRALVAAGFPVSLVACGLAATLPAWGWLVPAGLLLAAYPLSAWRDAPVFPTPANALAGLASVAPLPPGAAVLDAGCGLGHGLRALRGAWPEARLEGIERSLLLRAACALRCPWARVRGGDMWRDSWAPYDAVYVFQRPESMARALAKARAEMRPGARLVSLAFEVPDEVPEFVLRPEGGHPVWIYRPDRN